MEEIRIFIGTEPAQWLPTEVLKFSILKRTSAPVIFCDLKGIPLKLHSKMYTGFSFYRFCIPELCGYEGKAIYLDADMVVIADIADLYNLEMGEKLVLARPSSGGEAWFTSCMLLNCSRLKHWKTEEWVALINAGLTSYGSTMTGSRGGMNHDDFGDLPPEWNHLDEYNKMTKLIHYTKVPTQPWKRGGHQWRGIFLKELQAAIEEGVLTEADVQREIEAKHIYPEILEDMRALADEA